MAKDDKVKKSFEFLRSKAGKGEVITLKELTQETRWTVRNAKTNISKRLKQFLEQVRPDQYEVNSKILDVEYPAYLRLFKQANVLVKRYNEYLYPNVITFELFLPLTNEDKLRRALDQLFYKDSVRQRLQSVPIQKLKPVFNQRPNETNDDYMERLCHFISDKFGGYSIIHVNGRFRGSELLTKREALKCEENGNGYLFDETTAVVKFIFPIEATKTVGEDIDDVSHKVRQLPLQFKLNVNEEIAKIEFVFRYLFITAILNTVNQDEIWVLQSGKGIQLLRYVASSRDTI